jgi:Domain of unknown function (DUF1877)
MGMRAQCRRITAAQLDELKKTPDKIENFVHSGFGVDSASAHAARAALEKVQAIGLEARASGRLNDPAEREKIRDQILKELATAGVKFPSDPASDDSSEDSLNLEKSWHVLHYLLTGEPEGARPPLGNAILGGKEIGEERDYGRARFLTPGQVAEVASAIAHVSKDDLSRRFDLQRMKAVRIYAATDPGDLELAQMYFDRLSRYYQAAANQDAMLLWIE